MNAQAIQQIAEEIVEAGVVFYEMGLAMANDGNISCRLTDGSIMITPTGVSKGRLRADRMVRMTLDGAVIEAPENVRPSSEYRMHLGVYKERPDVQAVVHMHPPYTTAFSAAGLALKGDLLIESALLLGDVPVTAFALAGTDEVPDSVRPFCAAHNAVLLANHGVLTWGVTLQQASFRMQSLEQTARNVIFCRLLGEEQKISQQDLARLSSLL